MRDRLTLKVFLGFLILGVGDGAPTAVEWSHRWLVRGHWRRQRVGPGRSEIRPVWVQGHVKGPEGAPLVVSNHVYDLVR